MIIQYELRGYMLHIFSNAMRMLYAIYLKPQNRIFWQVVFLRIGDLQRIIRRLIDEGSDAILDLVNDAKSIAVELLNEAENVESILQYIEGALLEIFIIATILRIDIEKVLRDSLRRIETKKMKYYAE